MAFIAAEHPGMDIMAEDDLSHCALHGDIFRTLVAIAAVARNTERSVAVVTGAAGFTGFHLLHADQVTVAFRDKDVRMAFIATKHLGVSFMAEDHFLGEPIIDFNITCVAGDTVPADAESFLAGVAEAAGLFVFHLDHGDGRIVFGNNMKNVIVTDGTVLADRLFLYMAKMAELYLAYRVGLQVDFIFDPPSVENGRQGHRNQDREYHPTPCHNLPPSASWAPLY